MVRLIQRLAIFCLFISTVAGTASAQNSFSAAYRVNESIVSYFDIDQRMKLMQVLGSPAANLRQSATERLIDERLQVEFARSLGIEIPPETVELAITNFAEQRNMTKETLLARIRGRGVSREAFDDFLTAGIMWRSVLRARFGNMAAPSENDLNAQLNTIAVSSSSTIRLGEIALLYTERGQQATVDLANQLVGQLRGGANFQDIAREYSRSRSAPNGGVIGWVVPARLPPQLGAALRGLGRGQVAEPIFIPTGIIIIKILDSRTQTQQISVPTNINVTYAMLNIAHAADAQAGAIQQAENVRRGLDGCRNFQSLSEGFANGSGVFGPVSLAALPADVGLQLARLDPRESAVMTGANTVSVIVLCDRISEMSPESREALRNQLLTRNLNILSEGLMQEIRRTSIIEKQ